jgi:hypothetical protein
MNCVVGFRFVQRGANPVISCWVLEASEERIDLASPPRRPRSRADDEEEHKHENEHEEEQWDNDAKQIPGQGTKVRKANPADPSGWSY